MHTSTSLILDALTATVTSAFGLVMLAVASQAQPGSVADTQAALINTLPGKETAAAEGDSGTEMESQS